MSIKLKCVNVIMKGIGRKDAKEAYANFKFQLTSKVIELFEWPDISGASEWTPEAPHDQFRCHWIEITPNSSELASHAMKLDAATIGDFQIQKKAKKEGKNSQKAQKSVTDVLCRVRFNDPTALASLESFKVNANKNSEMLIAFDQAPEQGEIDGTRVDVVSGEVHATKEQQQAVLEIPMPTAAEKKAQREAERAKFAELRERAKKK